MFGSCRPAQESTRLLFYSQTDVLCFCSFSLELIQAQLETSLFFLFFTVWTKSSNVILMQTVQEPVQKAKHPPVFDHSIVLRHQTKCRTKLWSRIISKMHWSLSEPTASVCRSVSYFHTSCGFKIFCDTFFNNVTDDIIFLSITPCPSWVTL